jgi:hypothetical protein
MQSFDIYFLGEMLPDVDPAEVRRGVAQLFKVQDAAVNRLFSGKPLRVKQAVDADTASRYRSAFREVGALLQIVPSGDPQPADRVPGATVDSPPGAGARPQADNPESPATTDRQAPSATIGAAGLAEPGAILDHTPPPPPAHIDTGSLEALPPNSGSLEDCQVETPPRPIPDISHLKLVDD